MTISGVDVSNWQGVITPAQAACFQAHGIRHAVVRGSLESMDLVATAKAQIAALQAAGIDVSLYLWVYPSWDATKTVSDFNREYGRFDITRVWLDCEDDKDVAGTKRTAAWLRTAIAALRATGWTPGIYTSAWWWNDPAYMNGSTEFAALPLWTAYYDNNPDLSVWRPYGGWTALAGKQYTGTGALCDLSPLDLDVFDESVLPPKPGPGLDPAVVRGWLDELDQWPRDDSQRAAISEALRAERLAAMRAAVDEVTA